MNIHEHQAKELLKKFGANVPLGVFGLSVEEVLEKAKLLKTEKFVLKAQIHAGGRGKAGGVKIVDNIALLEEEAKKLFGKTLVTHQTGPSGREVKRLYVETASEIEKEFYLSCLVDRASAKIAFISSDQGGMNIEEVAIKSPEKIITTKVDFNESISEEQRCHINFGLAKACEDLGNFEQAIINLSNAILLDNKLVDAYGNRCVAYYAIGELSLIHI